VAASVSLRALWDAHAAHLLRSLRYLGVREADLDDALQETFVIAHKKIGDLREGGSPRAWLNAIALNVARHARRAKPLISIEEVAESEAESDVAGRLRDRAELLGLLGRLDDDKRELVVLYHLEQFTLREIAEIKQCPIQTVYSRLGAATRELEQAREGVREAG
jgi:RNA polymerase sigma-70 factor (ECF subfamily)